MEDIHDEVEKVRCKGIYCNSLESTGNSIILQTFCNKNVFRIPMWTGIFLMEGVWLFLS